MIFHCLVGLGDTENVPYDIIATRGNVIIVVILQWNIYYNKRIWNHPTYVPLVKTMKIGIH